MRFSRRFRILRNSPESRNWKSTFCGSASSFSIPIIESRSSTTSSNPSSRGTPSSSELSGVLIMSPASFLSLWELLLLLLPLVLLLLLLLPLLLLFLKCLPRLEYVRDSNILRFRRRRS